MTLPGSRLQQKRLQCSRVDDTRVHGVSQAHPRGTQTECLPLEWLPAQPKLATAVLRSSCPASRAVMLDDVQRFLVFASRCTRSIVQWLQQRLEPLNVKKNMARVMAFRKLW